MNQALRYAVIALPGVILSDATDPAKIDQGAYGPAAVAGIVSIVVGTPFFGVRDRDVVPQKLDFQVAGFGATYLAARALFRQDVYMSGALGVAGAFLSHLFARPLLQDLDFHTRKRHDGNERMGIHGHLTRNVPQSMGFIA